MGRHQFSGGIRCGQCGNVVSAVEAFSWRAAAQGKGVCDACLNRQTAQPAAAEEVGAGYSGHEYDTTVLASPRARGAVATESGPEVVGEVVKAETPKRGSRRGKAAS